MLPIGHGHVVSRTEPVGSVTGYRVPADLYCTVTCTHCGAYSVAWKTTEIDNHVASENRTEMHGFWRYNEPDATYPQHVEGQDFNYVPDHIASAASEAYKCHSIGAYMAAILIARTSIEAAAKDQGVTEGKLVQKINKLASEGLIRKRIKDAAHKVRIFGNDMAHGDIEIKVSKRDSEQVLRLLTFVLQDIYEVSELMEEVGISLDARKSEVGG